MASLKTDLRIGFVGPALGRNPGRVTTQGEVLADHFVRSGFEVRETSAASQPVLRGLHMGQDLLRWGRQVDVLIVSLYSGRSFLYADLATWLAGVVGRPAVVVLHGGNLPAFAHRHPRWVSRVLERAARIVAPSAFFVRWAHDQGWDAVEIPNVVPPGPYVERRLTRARPRLLWMRSFDDVHEPVLAVEVAARVAADHPDVQLTMAGQRGALLDQVEARRRDLGMQDRMRIAGFLSPAAKARAFADHDVFLHTSRLDNAPVSVVEAMAWGMVVVARPVGGIPDLIRDGVDGLLGSPDSDAGALAAAVDRALTDHDLASRVSREAVRTSGRNQWTEVEPRWRQLLDELV